VPWHEDLLSLSKILNKTDFNIISLSVLAALENFKMLTFVPHPMTYYLLLYYFIVSLFWKKTELV